ncbi:Stk1 family PASTA domain-containing Ser/Thr kinase [Lacrimispora indolis]|uniref:Stk1 family PASTA domain-containing Ser/Thr kinase n=1 Tax=Lacrimispora indolis TaxID=69825 RepID=UPI0004AFFED8|nr:Stk1 family PASTA domain-containing Ser/Thr kinase [Lacrimispora indolis]MBE7718998.1 Stk1 family PASTA domain-containing Ser/Thr kinase [Lacrimispora celerecrescens]
MILRPGTFLQDRYEILDQIGSGGMSDVYKALCHKLNRPVAIKVLKEEFSSDSGFVGKFKMEAQAAACLSHPNIVNIYDVVDEGTLHYIVMELIEGITLKNYISKKGCLDVKEAIGVAISVAQGIAAAHEQGIIHRDIKPQNIIIARDGKVKVADFGIARAASSQTLSATAVGSVHYISPEQARGGYSDVRSDIYSLGITMYEMVAGRVPFQGDNTVTVALAHLEDPITPPSFYNENIPVGLENIILKCTEKKPEYRYGSMHEVISDLRKALVNPDGDFVQYNSQVDDSQTVIIGKPELEQIRSGRKVQADPAASRNVSRNQEQRPERRMEKNAGQQPGNGRNRKQDSEDDINPKIERLLTAAGIVVAILIVIVLIIVFSKVSGLFRSGSPKETESTAEISTEETLSDKKVKMTSVVGLATDIAEQKLKDNGGLYMKVSDYVFHDTIDKGDIVSQDPAEGTVIDKYSAVYVVVSKGPEHVAIDLTKLGLDKMDGVSAKAALEGNGLIVNVEQKNHDTVTTGYVISYSPSEAKEGETVTLVVSTGPALVNPVTVPNIAGQTHEVALEMLADVGLVAGTVTEAASETVPWGSVISQSLTADSQVEAGTSVDFVVSSGTAQQSKVKYLASIDKSYSLQNIIGPGSGSTQLTLKIQLRQSVNGKDEIRELMGPVTMTGDQMLPVSFKNIEGAYGVNSGTVEIVNVETGDVINSYSVTFIPVPQS